ncbi:MAG: TolC family protein [Gammaproteobacteria bacterium]
MVQNDAFDAGEQLHARRPARDAVDAKLCHYGKFQQLTLDKPRLRVYRTFTVVGAALILGGCASYAPKLLPSSVSLGSSVDRLEVAAAKPARQTAEALSLDEVAELAIWNNPDLKAQRTRLGVARAQLYAAGLFPDPQLTANLDVPTGATAGLVNAYGIGLGYDLIPLINRGARVASARQGQRQVNLELLWQEWQVSQQARFLAVRWVSERRQLALLRRMSALYQERYRRSDQALQQGDLTVDVVGTDLTALLDTLSQMNQLEQTHNDTGHALRLVLGLAPAAPLAICLPPAPPAITSEELSGLLNTLPKRRPDLLALQAGYESQEAKVRAAILSQFPSLSIGVTRARDTGNVQTSGFNIGVNLPLFSGNRGAIAIERATREQLRGEYQARLDQAEVDVCKLYQLQGIIAAQQTRLDEYLPTLHQLVDKASVAYGRRDIDALTFLNMETTWINKRLEQTRQMQSQWENDIALRTLLAIPALTPMPARPDVENDPAGRSDD